MRTAPPIPAPIMLIFLLLGLAVAGSVAIWGRSALHVLSFGNRAAYEGSEASVVVLRSLASFVAVSVVGMLIRWAITGVAP